MGIACMKKEDDIVTLPAATLFPTLSVSGPSLQVAAAAAAAADALSEKAAALAAADAAAAAEAHKLQQQHDTRWKDASEQLAALQAQLKVSVAEP